MGDRGGGADLPDSLRHYFWDYPTDRLSLERSRSAIIVRLVQSGGLDAVKWLRHQLGDNELRAFLVRRRGRGIGARRLRFWGLILGVPRAQVDEWIGSAAANPWSERIH